MKNFIKRIFNIKAITPFVVLCSALSFPAFAGVTTPTKYLVTFYRVGFLNTSDGTYFDLFNNPGGIQIDISKTGAATALVSNAPAPPLGKTYDSIYGIVKNVYVINGSSAGCYTRASAVNSDTTTPWVTSNVAQSGDLVMTHNHYFPGFGPLLTDVDGTVTGAASAITMYSFLVNSSNPLALQNGIPVGTSNNDVELYIGRLSNPINPSSFPQKIFSLGFNVTNKLTLNCNGDSFASPVSYSMTLE